MFKYFVKTEVVQNKIPDHYSPSTQFPVDTIKSNPAFFLLYYALFKLKQQQITESKTVDVLVST